MDKSIVIDGINKGGSMNIIRHSKPTVTCIDNEIINDRVLSAQLLGYLAFIQSLPDEEVNVGDLASRFSISIGAAHASMALLVSMGYLQED